MLVSRARPLRRKIFRFSFSSSLREVEEFEEQDCTDNGEAAKVALARTLGLKQPEESMRRVMDILHRSSNLFKISPDHAVPEVRFSQIEAGNFPLYVRRQINRRGVVVVRDAVPQPTALRWRDNVLEYLLQNGRWERPPVLHPLFYSAAQQEARQHVRLQSVLAALLGLWHHDPGVRLDLTRSLAFCDRLFVGKQCSPSREAAAGPAMQGGGLQRWLDPSYQRLYERIWSGRFEDYDPFRADFRVALAERASGCDGSGGRGGLVEGWAGTAGTGAVPLRPFQGFVSLAQHGEDGAMRVVPMMRVATAFMMLRPFIGDDADGMCGASTGPVLKLRDRWHAPLADALVRIPPLSPGDAVFWHPDIIHAETPLLQQPDRDYVGLMLSAMPVCAGNSAYVKEQRGAVAAGTPPPAFAGAGGSVGGSCVSGTSVSRGGGVGGCGVVNGGVGVGYGEGGSQAGTEAAFTGRGKSEDMSALGKQVLGLGAWPKEHKNEALLWHHRMLGLPHKF